MRLRLFEAACAHSRKDLRTDSERRHNTVAPLKHEEGGLLIGFFIRVLVIGGFLNQVLIDYQPTVHVQDDERLIQDKQLTMNLGPLKLNRASVCFRSAGVPAASVSEDHLTWGFCCTNIPE